MPAAHNIHSITGAPVYKRLKVRYVQGDDDEDDQLIFGKTRSGEYVLSEPFEHQSNGLPWMIMLTDSKVAELMAKGIPRYHSHIWPDPRPYDYQEALEFLASQTSKAETMIRETLHVADPQRREMEAHLYKEEVMHMLTMHQSSSSLAIEWAHGSPRSEDSDPGGFLI